VKATPLKTSKLIGVTSFTQLTAPDVVTSDLANPPLLFHDAARASVAPAKGRRGKAL